MLQEQGLQERWLYAITENANGSQNDQYYVFYDNDIYEDRLLDIELPNPNMDISEILAQYDNIRVLETKIIDKFKDDEDQSYIYIVYATITTKMPDAKTVSTTELKKVIDNSSVLSNTVKRHLLASIKDYN